MKSLVENREKFTLNHTLQYTFHFHTEKKYHIHHRPGENHVSVFAMKTRSMGRGTGTFK